MPRTEQKDLSFLSKCTAVSIQCHSLSFSKKLPKSAITTESDPERINGSKKLLDCDEAAAIKSEFTRVKNYVKDRSLPTPFGEAIFFVPNTRLEECDAELLMSQQSNIPRLVAALLAVYSDVLEKEQTALGPNFNPGDYDTPEELRARVALDFAYVTFGIPENLPDVIRMREAEKQGQRLMESVDAMQELLRKEMAELVKHAVDRLTGKKDDGKPKIFRNTMITNIKEFIEIFRDRNITSDKEMEIICSRAQSLLDGVDPNDLRTQEPLRESLAKGFADIKTSLDAMLVPRGSRAITFEEDEEQTAAA